MLRDLRLGAGRTHREILAVCGASAGTVRPRSARTLRGAPEPGPRSRYAGSLPLLGRQRHLFSDAGKPATTSWDRRTTFLFTRALLPCLRHGGRLERSHNHQVSTSLYRGPGTSASSEGWTPGVEMDRWVRHFRGRTRDAATESPAPWHRPRPGCGCG